MKRLPQIPAVLLLAILAQGRAQAQDGRTMVVRVVDVGAGLCCVVDAPGVAADSHHDMIYDAGNFEDGGKTAITAKGRTATPAFSAFTTASAALPRRKCEGGSPQYENR